MGQYVTGIGGANIDLHGSSVNPIVMRDSNPGHLHTSLGGVTRNILDNLARLGVAVKLCSTVGKDIFGDAILAGCERFGIDTSPTAQVEGARSSCYLSVMDDSGDMLVAMSDMSIMKGMGASFVEQRLPVINGGALAVCDGNLSREAMECLTGRATVPLFWDPVSTAWARQHADLVGRFDTIKPNQLEMEVLAGGTIRDEQDLSDACDRLLCRGTRHIFVSRGAQGIYYKGIDGQVSRASRPFNRVANATGAGDATMASLIYSRLAGALPGPTVSFALAAGIAAIASTDTINPGMSVSLVKSYEKEYVL